MKTGENSNTSISYLEKAADNATANLEELVEYIERFIRVDMLENNRKLFNEDSDMIVLASMKVSKIFCLCDHLKTIIALLSACMVQAQRERDEQ